MWTDRAGQSRWAMVRILDLSDSGVRLEVPQPIETLCVVSFSSDDMNLSGQATVRFCRRQGTKYVVGAEFSGEGPVHLHSPE